MLKTSELHSFKDHPYKVIDNNEMAELTESIAEYGVLSPLIVRKDDNGYEVISGHRRLHAAVNSGLTEVPALVYNISRDEAAVMVVDSNLNREHILPSEKAAAYKMKYEALKHQGKASSHYETKLRTDEAIAETTGESRATIQRYMRLTELTPEWLNLVDEGRLAINTAVEISFLPEAHQNHLFSFYDENEILPTPKQAVEMKKLFQNGCL
ncbi:MAG: ParB/RepB/Spo0J family partition protein, partial [Ruminococcus sp.]|nr:ParB/RepB/Spo0J family partition protein [Candidatus Copronaster equi]